MMRKVLVLTLVLVLAFASSASAAVSFSGKFTAKFEQKGFKLGVDPYSLEPTLGFTISASNKNVTTIGEDEEAEEIVNWDFSAGLNLVNSKFELGKYKLVLADDYFTASIWGNKQELSDKATYFGMIKAGKAAGEDQMRARLEFDVVDVADVAIDFEPTNNIRTFVELNDIVEGFDFGLAYARKGWTADGASNVVVGQVGTDIEAGSTTIGLTAAAGLDIKEDLGFAVGVGADMDLTEQLNVNASVTHANDKWEKGDGVEKDATVISGTVTWTEAAIKAKGSVTQTIADENENVIGLDVWYRFSDTLGYNDLFKGDKWFTNDAPAAHAYASLTDVKLGMVGIEVASPVLEDFIWAKAYGKYGAMSAKNDEGEEIKDNSYEVGLDGYIKATEKLVITPYASFAGIGKFLTVGTGASYKIGLSDTTIDLTLKKVKPFDEDFANQEASLIQAKVTVPF